MPNKYVALLRAVNVGGTGKLPMTELKAMCEKAGFASVRTFIASGNVVFEADASPDDLKARLEAELRGYAGKPVGVAIRTAAEMQSILAENPFAEHAAARTLVVFLDAAPPPDALAQARGALSEEMRLGAREIYIYYPEGVGASKLRIPAAEKATARNINTVAKLAELAAKD